MPTFFSIVPRFEQAQLRHDHRPRRVLGHHRQHRRPLGHLHTQRRIAHARTAVLGRLRRRRRRRRQQRRRDDRRQQRLSRIHEPRSKGSLAIHENLLKI